jgi:hypothetical protein
MLTKDLTKTISASELPTSTDGALEFSTRSRFRAAMVLAMVADGLQMVLFPLFSEGALSPADDILDVGLALILSRLIGWHWEFLPSFCTKLVPGVDLVPFWTLAVANVYRKWKKESASEEIQQT